MSGVPGRGRLLRRHLRRRRADSTVYLFLTFLPSQFAVAGLFLIACFVSISMGTSVGTIAALAPIAVGISDKRNRGSLCIGAWFQAQCLEIIFR